MGKFSDQQLINMIQSGDDKARMKAYAYLYTANQYGIKQKIITLVTKQRGTKEDGQDICHDAFIIVDRNIREGRFKGQSGLSTYIIAVAKWLWWNGQRKFKPILGLNLELISQIEKSVEEYMLAKERRNLIDSAIRALPERCQQVMSMNIEGFTTKEINEALQHENEKQTENTLTRCRKKLRNILKNLRP